MQDPRCLAGVGGRGTQQVNNQGCQSRSFTCLPRFTSAEIACGGLGSSSHFRCRPMTQPLCLKRQRARYRPPSRPLHVSFGSPPQEPRRLAWPGSAPLIPRNLIQRRAWPGGQIRGLRGLLQLSAETLRGRQHSPIIPPANNCGSDGALPSVPCVGRGVVSDRR